MTGMPQWTVTSSGGRSRVRWITKPGPLRDFGPIAWIGPRHGRVMTQSPAELSRASAPKGPACSTTAISRLRGPTGRWPTAYTPR